jgi:hypothetical protein
METISMLRNVLQTKWRKKDEILELSFGEQDELDALSYAGLEERPDFIQIDGCYIRSILISGYPFVASSGWLDNLINFNHNVDIS